MSKLLLKSVRKSYKSVEVIHGVDVAIEEGEFVVIVGPSGCGKSTLLRMVAGLESVTQGDVCLNDERINDREPKDRNMAMVFQNYALYPHMTVFDNMAYGLKMRHYKKSEIKKLVLETASVLELDTVLYRKPAALSGGQRQRVAMGRAIVRSPELYLFDEPLSNLDASLRTQMRVEIKRLQRKFGVTSIYVTHDQVEAMTLADRLIVMNQGVAEQIDTPLNIYQHPATEFVAKFIGTSAMNFLPAKICEDGSHVLLASDMAIGLSKVMSAHTGRKVNFAVRPEHLAIVDGEDDRHFTLQVDLIEALGSDTLVYGHLPGTKESITVRLPGSVRPRTGEQLNLTVLPESIHLFDPDSGRRIV